MIRERKGFYTVTEVTGHITDILDNDDILSRLSVKGEVTGCSFPSSGHIYFSLKDNNSIIPCVMWSSKRRNMNFNLSNGAEVIVSGNISVYEKSGKYQLYANSIRKEGAGELWERYEALKNQLEARGFFDASHKKPIPKYIKTLGIVTSPTGDAIEDIVKNVRARNPYVQMYLYPSLVQGAGASLEIAKGIRAFNRFGVDVIIIGRGGGSLEELWAFNEFAVAEAVYESEIPVVSAVGHEPHFALSDFVADLRVSTPTKAHEIVFSYNEFGSKLAACVRDLQFMMNNKLDGARTEAEYRRKMLELQNPVRIVKVMRKEHAEKSRKLSEIMERLINENRNSTVENKRVLDDLIERRIIDAKNRIRGYSGIHDFMNRRITDAKNRLKSYFVLHEVMERRIADFRKRTKAYSEILEGLSPRLRLDAGYSFIRKAGGGRISSIEDIANGEILDIYLADGGLLAEVKDKKRYSDI